MSTYSYSLDDIHIRRLQRAFIKNASKLGLYDGRIVNLDFHTAPHYGEESVLEEHWAGARNKRVKGALTLFAQDSESKLILYTPADIRQVVVRRNGHEKPAFVITNDFDMPVELVVGNYARRWRVENGIAEAVKFFHLNALSSPILVKIHFDMAMTMVADTLYTMLAQKLRGF